MLFDKTAEKKIKLKKEIDLSEGEESLKNFYEEIDVLSRNTVIFILAVKR